MSVAEKHRRAAARLYRFQLTCAHALLSENASKFEHKQQQGWMLLRLAGKGRHLLAQMS